MGLDSLGTGDEETPVMDWEEKRRSCNVEDLTMIYDVCRKRPGDLSLWEKSLDYLQYLKCKRDFFREIRERGNQCILEQPEENKGPLQELGKEM